MVNSAWTMFLGFGAVAGMGLLIGAVRRWPLVGLIVVGAWASVAWEAVSWGPLVSISGTNVFIPDLIAVVLAVTATLQSRQLARNLRRWIVIWILILVCTVGSLLVGLMLHKYGDTFTEFRPFFYFIAAISWSMSIDFSRVGVANRFGTAVIGMGWILCIVAGLHIVSYGLGGVSAFVPLGDDGGEQSQRGLISGQALLLLLALLQAVSAETTRRPVLKGATLAVFASVLIVTEQRTVWVAAAVALVAFILFGSRLHRRRSVGLIMAGVAAFGLLFVLDPAGPLLPLLGDAATNASTYGARQTSWIALVGQNMAKGPFAILFGTEFGAGFGRYEGAGRWVVYSPHNMYVFLLLRVGVVGLFAFVLGLGATLVAAVRARRSARIIVLVLVFAVYGWAYQLDWYTAPVLGLAIVAAAAPLTGSGVPAARNLVTREAR